MEAKEIKSLMEAYASVYENQEQIDEYAQGGGGAAPNVPPAVHKFVDELPQKASKFLQTITGAAKPKPKEKPVKEENLFDIIKGHLMSKGYADTEEAALKIMANMSETWKQSIVEAKVDKQLPEHERSGARLKRYDNPSGALALGGGQQRTRRQEHEERRGKKK